MNISFKKDKLSKRKIRLLTQDSFSADRFFVFKNIESTNLYAKSMCQKKDVHERVVISDTQKKGRGRLGREFFSPQGTGIYMSIILDSEKISIPASLLTVAAGVAVCRVIKEISGGSPAIKWVNDVFLNKKKVSGILAEGVSSEDSSFKKYIVLGIGVNVFSPKKIIPPELNEIFGEVNPKNITRNEIIAKILFELKKIYESPDPSLLISEYKRYSLVLGKEISFTKDNISFKGIASDIGESGELVVTLNSGEKISLNSGEVSLGSSNFLK